MEKHRLRKHAEYQVAYKAARRQSGKHIAWFAAPRSAERRSDTAGPRIGLTVPKALGKAVDRNRIKRRLRHAVRAHLALLTAPVDLILHPRRSVIDLDFATLEREVALIFRSAQAAHNRAAATQHRAAATQHNAAATQHRAAATQHNAAATQHTAPATPSGQAPSA